jgi:ATP-dependent DNA helicase PIF1
MEFSREQQLAFDKYVMGNNIFITGPGGSGKSALMKQIYQHSTEQKKRIHVTAMTGCAAVLLNCKAKTLHSWANIGLGNNLLEEIVYKINKNKRSKAMWKLTDILVIDEVSMLSLKIFNLLNAIGKKLRQNLRPFGGIQIIFSGDFYQLPPVGSRDDPESTQFCFESKEWNNAFEIENQIQLRTIYRQTDFEYTQILNQIREGKIKRSSITVLNNYVNRDKSDEILVVKLYPTRSKVEQINKTEMEKLDSQSKEFKLNLETNLEMSNSDKTRRLNFSKTEIDYELEYLTKNVMCEKILVLKRGAQVMSNINIKDEFDNLLVCNGSQGQITEFDTKTGSPIVQFNNGHIMKMHGHIWKSEKIPGVGVSQIPLMLSWALTIHKSQGVTLDNAEIDIGSNVFACGQSYVALSRLKSLDGLYLKSFDVTKIRINEKVKEFYNSLDLLSKDLK